MLPNKHRLTSQLAWAQSHVVTLTCFPLYRNIYPWDRFQIKEVADTIRSYCFPMFKHIPEPKSYHDLHDWWDSTDLWELGVQNLWNVLRYLYWETLRELPDLSAEVRVCVEEWAGVLLEDHKRRAKLVGWNEDEDGYDILGAFHQEELKDLDGLDMYWLPVFTQLPDVPGMPS
ncbi:hypothetical protein PG989_011356 [Apiospora arundinis]